MALYQTSKQITKFTISGLIAVAFDFGVYYGLSNLFKDASINPETVFIGFNWNDIFKAMGFMSGTFVTYNLNKFWTWRKSDKNHKRLMNFMVLYSISFVINVLINKWALSLLGDNEIAFVYRTFDKSVRELIVLKTDKLFAFILATAVSSIVNFVGQKIWVFSTGVDPINDTDDSE
ncbi:MAG: hypothetical protein GC181_00305 [Bacteroidetes bacterium]|nr:hypothetical protein [Bacteroidota bacterium]